MSTVATRSVTRAAWQAEGVWQAQTSVYTGGDPRFENNADMALLRDSEGRFLIPGASVRGAARAYLRKKYGEEPPALRALFGDDFGGLLFTSDSPALGDPEPIVRDHVKIEPDRRTASDEGKFNREVLPKGTRFAMRVRVMVPVDLPQSDPTRLITDRDLEGVLRDLLEAFSRGEIRLGGKKTRGSGYGAVSAGWNLYRWNLREPDELLDWLSDTKPAAEAVSVLTAPPAIDERRSFSINCDLRLDGSLLIRSALGDLKAPDMVHPREAGEPLLPFTAVCGPLRQQCLAIALGLLVNAEGIVDRMFGPLYQFGKRQHLFASRVSGPDAMLRNVEWRAQTRVALDRFTGAPLDSALFDQAAVWPRKPGEEHVTLRLEFDETPRGGERPEDLDRMVALLLVAFKEVWLGSLPIGGEAGVGRGVFRGVRAHLERTGQPTLALDAAGRVSGWDSSWSDVMATLEGGRP